MPNFSKLFILETDASGIGIGAVLMPENRPFAYFSKLLGVKVQEKSIYEKELMAICLAVTKWKYYLMRCYFIVRTDQQSLHYITQQREIGGDYHKWVSKLMAYSFEIQYKPGKSNLVVDALSRKTGGEVKLGAMLSITGVGWKQLHARISADSVLQQLIQDLQNHNKEHAGFQMVGERLLYKGRVVLPQQSRFRDILLAEYHNSPLGGHTGEVRIYLRMAADWYWVGMRKEVTNYVRSCNVCQQQKLSQHSPAGLLQPLQITSQDWSDISMDFIQGLPKSKGVDTIFLVVDRLSKYAHFIGLQHPFTAFSVVEAFVREIVRLHGFPE